MRTQQFSESMSLLFSIQSLWGKEGALICHLHTRPNVSTNNGPIFFIFDALKWNLVWDSICHIWNYTSELLKVYERVGRYIPWKKEANSKFYECVKIRKRVAYPYPQLTLSQWKHSVVSKCILSKKRFWSHVSFGRDLFQGIWSRCSHIYLSVPPYTLYLARWYAR